MKKAKLFMMLALLVMGVSNVWGATQHFNVVYTGRSVAQGAGYTADNGTITYTQWILIVPVTRTAGTIQNVEPDGFDIIGDYATNVNNYRDYIAQHITPTPVEGYSASVSVSGTTVTIAYSNVSVRYRVIYEDELLPGAGYTIRQRNVTNGSITSNDNDYILVITGNGNAVPSGFTTNNIGNYIQANAVSGYTPSVSLVTSEAQMGYAGNIYINYITNTTPTVEEDANWYYSNVYERDTHTKILLPTGECAISLKNTSLVTADIPLTSPSGKTVVAIQKFGLTYQQTPEYKPDLYNCSRTNNNYHDTPDNRSSHYYSDYNNPNHNVNVYGYDHRNENLVTVNFPAGSQVRSIGDYAFVCCLELVSVNNIPSCLEYLGTGAFAVGEKLKIVDFPSSASVKAIKNATFWACTAMERLYLPEGIIEIEGQSSGAAMQYMTSLVDVHLPNTLKYIGPHFLCSAQSLRTLRIPVSVEYIDGACFHGCESLETVYILGPAAVLQNADGDSGTFSANVTLCADPVNNCTFYTTTDNLAGYQNDPVWSKINNNGVWDQATSGYTRGWGNYLKAIPEETRTLPTKWVTAVFPHEVARSTFGTGTLLARMDNCDGYTTQNVDGKTYRVYHLNFTEITGDNIPENVPLLIKAGQETEYAFYNAADQEEDWFKLHATDPLTVAVICNQDGTEITMKGEYLGHNIRPGEFYFKNNNADFTTDKNGNTVEHPKFLIAPETGYVTIDPCRCWWTIEQDKHIPGSASIAPAKRSSFFGETETTGIEEVETRIVIDAIYDLNGHKIDVKPEDLPQGLFIINGKKVLKK